MTAFYEGTPPEGELSPNDDDPGQAPGEKSPGSASEVAESDTSFRRNPWLVFIVPLALYMALGSMEPAPPTSSADSPAAAGENTSATDSDTPIEVGFTEWGYPLAYSLRAALVAAAIGIFWVGFPGGIRVSPLAVGVGLVGAVLWIGICNLGLEPLLLGPLGMGDIGQRASFNPLDSMSHCWGQLTAFLVIRFVGLVILVPIAEEAFLRGFLMRFVMEADWWKLPIGAISATAVGGAMFYAGASHPGELIAALAWFGMVTYLVAVTRNFWDAVIAHAVTNLMLGIWVVAMGQWHLW